MVSASHRLLNNDGGPVPTYEYACSNCDTTHEVQQKMTDPTLTDCPSCGQSTLRKLFSGVGIHFKGSGFYRTDSRDSKSATAPAASSSGSSSSDSSSSGSSSSGSSDSSSSTPAASTTSSTSSSTPAASSSS
jgi:putative FmdB family regulatory protein